ncbi:hypothetical protein [Parasitella parasitica]|uniref:Uncharacterized protein n=1 Tax=Parasitella parasitica TaxID=35722 RepID=A0A0B7N6L5_9FUNG|nr:hypothetical protein [Parasitella parasitica]
MGVVLSTLTLNKKNRRGDVEDVTKSPLIISSYRRLPNMNCEEFPSKNDQPSMSSSIIETTVLNQEHDISQQHNVTDITTKLKIPKRAWSAFQLFDLSDTLKKDTIINSPIVIKSPRARLKTKEITEEDDDEDEEDDEPVEMEQLITMMQNHKVSDESSTFDFNCDTGNDNNTSNNNKMLSMPPPPPSPSSQSSSRRHWSPSPDFKFSFSANIHRKNYANSYVDQEFDFNQGNQQQQQRQQQNQTVGENDDRSHVMNRKILPMPKPRWKKSSDKDSDSITSKDSTNNNNCNTMILGIPANDKFVESKVDQRDNLMKPNPSSLGECNPLPQNPNADNKRKERNWMDQYDTTEEATEARNHAFYAFEKQKPFVRFSSPLKNEVPVDQIKVTVSESQLTQKPLPPPLSLSVITSNTTTAIKPSSTPSTITAAAVVPAPVVESSVKKPASKRKGRKSSVSPSQPTYTKKGNNNATITKKKSALRKKVNKEDVAPGGFLSSDINLFENPISADDWICLFCQYDILMYGFEDDKKKNKFHQKKREKSRKIKGTELKRLGGGSDEPEEHHTTTINHM